MRLLVTGGAGFIGSNFIRYWLTRHSSDRIVNLDLLTYAGDRASLADVEQEHGTQHRFVHGDIADGVGVSDLIAEERPDVIVNLAAESHNSRAVLDPGAFITERQRVDRRLRELALAAILAVRECLGREVHAVAPRVERLGPADRTASRAAARVEQAYL